jgi:outer membrane protein assembly factor BamA
MKAALFAGLLAIAAASPANAQQGLQGCIPGFDSIAVNGVVRMTRDGVLAAAGIPVGGRVCVQHLREAIELLYASGQISDVSFYQTAVGGRQVLIIEITERPMFVVRHRSASGRFGGV